MMIGHYQSEMKYFVFMISSRNLHVFGTSIYSDVMFDQPNSHLQIIARAPEMKQMLTV